MVDRRSGALRVQWKCSGAADVSEQESSCEGLYQDPCAGWTRSRVEGGAEREIKGIVGAPIGWSKRGEVWVGYHLSKDFQTPRASLP